MATERIFTDQLSDWKRSCYCGEPRATAVGNELTLFGWVRGRRDHGGVIFVDLRDRSGICQIVLIRRSTQQPMKKPNNSAPKT